MTDSIGIIDETDENRFVLREGEVEAELTYQVDGQRLILIHTGVPEAFRGRGIGGHLVRAAVDRASVSNETVAPWCTYARKWLEDHPDEAAAVTIDWRPPPRS